MPSPEVLRNTLKRCDVGHIHYMVAAVIITVYSGVVCPLIAALSISDVILPVAISTAMALLIRGIFRRTVDGVDGDA